MTSFIEELKLAREMARNKHKLHKQNDTEEKNMNINIINDDNLLQYSKKETIRDQIRCNHGISAKTKCIDCVSRKLLPFNKKQLSLKYGLFNFVFQNKNNKDNIKNLISISRQSNPILLDKSQPISSLQYGEILFYSFGHILQIINEIQTIEYNNTIFIDFGSGIAKTLIIASLLYEFKQCIGIEIIHKLHKK
eukprot:89273_1